MTDRLDIRVEGSSLVARCKTCGDEAELLIDREMLDSRDLFMRTVSRWTDGLDDAHRHEPTRPTKCRGAPREHFFPGVLVRELGAPNLCACGLTPEEAEQQALAGLRAEREHAEMGWP